MSDFGRALAAIRRERDLTQEDVATSASLTRVTVANIESGKHVPGWDTVCKLADALGVSADLFRRGPKYLVQSGFGRTGQATGIHDVYETREEAEREAARLSEVYADNPVVGVWVKEVWLWE